MSELTVLYVLFFLLALALLPRRPTELERLLTSDGFIAKCPKCSSVVNGTFEPIEGSTHDYFATCKQCSTKSKWGFGIIPMAPVCLDRLEEARKL